MSKELTYKPLKGLSVSGNSGVFDTLQTNNLILSSENIESLFTGTQIVDVTILDSAIQNTIIGANSPNEGYFTKLSTTNDVVFTTGTGQSVNWDSTNGIFTIVGSLNIYGCSTLGNILICNNDIKALNTNGDLNLIPKGLGTIYLTGPVSNIASSGNYLTSLANGNITFVSSDYINLTSQSSSSSINTFSDQTYTTVNGDISLSTDSGCGQKLVTNVYSTSGSIAVSTAQPSDVRIGDTITLSNTNSLPTMNGSFLVTQIINSNTFSISTGNTTLTTNATTGILFKPKTNNINLNAGNFVTIPSDIKLTFGSSSNSLSGNTGGMIVNSSGDINLNVPSTNIINIPQTTKVQLGTSGNNYINYDGNSINVFSYNNINLSGSSGYMNFQDMYIQDPNPVIANYTQLYTDNVDKGIQFKYWSGGNSSLGWFGYKQSTGKFTFLTSATNSNEVLTGTLGKLDIGDISTTSISINSSGSFVDVNCGSLLNVKLITGCGGTININSSNNVNITTGTRLALISGGDIYVPNNIPFTFGTTGSSVKEGTSGSMFITAARNIYMNMQTNGSVVIQPTSKISFDGTSVGNQSISSDTSGNFTLLTNKNINLQTTGGNVVVPANTSLQFGNSTETISGSTSGLFLYSQSTFGSVNIIATSNVNVSSTFGNISLSTSRGDIQLYTTNGNTRLLQGSYLVFGINSTSNSIRTNSSGNLSLYGTGTNSIDIKNASTINLNANNTINIPTSVQVNFDGGVGSRYLITDSSSNILLTNSNASSGTFITSLNTVINNTGGTTILNNATTNISTSTFTLTGTNAFINTTNVKMTDPILSLANYTLTSNDLKDRGIEFNYFSTTGSMKLGWFGFKNNTQQFTYYSDAINTGEVISGTLGTFSLGSLSVSSNISFGTTGNINMNCGTISNLNTILGCGGTVNINTSQNMNINSSNIFLSASSKILIPNTTPLSFGNTSTNISSDTNGNLMITANNGSGTLVLNSNVQINGTTSNVFSTITNVQDPIFSIGGVTGPVINDGKDRGIEFKWYGTSNGTTGSKVGFFGFKNSTQRFTFIPDDTNVNEVISGNTGDVQFANGYVNNLDVSCGTVANVSVITGCAMNGLSIISSSGNISISSANINLPSNSLLAFGSTSNSISATSSGNLNINSLQNTVITSNTGGIIFNTNTSGSGYTQFSNNSPMYFGSASSGNFLKSDTSGNFNITNTSGDIYISPYTNNSLGSYGNVIIPTNDSLVFGNSSTRIASDGSSLQLYGYSIGFNSTTTITFNGNVNILGSVASVDAGRYIYPLGTRQQLTITSIVNSSTIGNILVSTNIENYLVVGDTVTLTNTDSTPNVNNTYIVNQIISNTTFSIPNTILSSSGTTGIMYGVLKTYQGKDVGIEVDYWSTVGNTSVTAGSVNYKQAFFGWLNNTQQWTYYSNATIQNNVVTGGVLGDLRANELFAKKISGFTLDGPIVGSMYTIAGSNFQISGGAIDNTPIGQTTAQTGRFSSLDSTVSTSLQNVTMQSNLNYSVERFTLSSLLPTRSPSTSVITTFINISGNTFIATGSMTSTGISDGQVKKLICSSMGNNCKYVLSFQSGTLIAPNPLNGPQPTTATFKSSGQSLELLFDSLLNGWVISGGNGCQIN